MKMRQDSHHRCCCVVKLAIWCLSCYKVVVRNVYSSMLSADALSGLCCCRQIMFSSTDPAMQAQAAWMQKGPGITIWEVSKRTEVHDLGGGCCWETGCTCYWCCFNCWPHLFLLPVLEWSYTAEGCSRYLCCHAAFACYAAVYCDPAGSAGHQVCVAIRNCQNNEAHCTAAGGSAPANAADGPHPLPAILDNSCRFTTCICCSRQQLAAGWSLVNLLLVW